MKTCSKCKAEKPLSFFNKGKAYKDGLNPQCKQCISESMRAYYSKTKEDKLAYQKAYRLKNLDKIQAYLKEYHSRQYRDNKEQVDQRNKKWNVENVERRKSKMRENRKKAVDAIAPYYVAMMIRQKTKSTVRLSEIPQELIIQYSILTQLKRELKNIKQNEQS